MGRGEAENGETGKRGKGEREKKKPPIGYYVHLCFPDFPICPFPLFVDHRRRSGAWIS
jgi:hypothetical protein